MAQRLLSERILLGALNTIPETGKGTALGGVFGLLFKGEYRKVGVDLEGLPDRGRRNSHTEEGAGRGLIADLATGSPV